METYALRYLSKQGLHLLERNYRTRLGEIDLIMQDSDCLVFIEVRARSNRLYGTASESVTLSKQQKIIKTATCFLSQNPGLSQQSIRFDVISIDKFSAIHQKKWQLDWIKNAFQVDCLF